MLILRFKVERPEKRIKIYNEYLVRNIMFRPKFQKIFLEWIYFLIKNKYVREKSTYYK